MSHIVSPYDRQGGFLESKLGMAAIFMAGLFSIGIHIFVGWALLFWLPGLIGHKTPSAPEYITVELLGDLLPPAPAAPDGPVAPDLTGPDVVDAPKSAPDIVQPIFTPSTQVAVTAPAEVIPLGPKAPEKPPQQVKRTPPPKPTVPKVEKDPPPKKTPEKTNSKASDNKAAEVTRKTPAAADQPTPDSDKVNRNIAAGGGSGSGSQNSGSAGESRLHPQAASYYGHVRDLISRNWLAPPEEMRNLATIVRMDIAPSGQITAIRMHKPSGNAIYDESVLKAIKMSSPLPVPPAIFAGKPFTTPMFEFTPEDLNKSRRQMGSL